MEEEILKLRKEGKTYKQIQEILGCSKGTISYHCGRDQKEKTSERRKRRRENPLIKKVDNFKYKKIKKIGKKTKIHKTKKDVDERVRFFQKRNGNKIDKTITLTFNWEDVVEKFGENTSCYLSGEPINLYETNYHLDHIMPQNKGGDNSFENLGITHEIVNRMKTDLTPEELIKWCIKILKHNGYNITK